MVAVPGCDIIRFMKTAPVSPKQKAAKGILITLAILAGIAGLGNLFDLPDTAKATLTVETWRVVGFFTFAALFGLLARRPNNRDVWNIVLANKLALSIIGVLYMVKGGIQGANDLVTFDGTITVLLIVAGILQGVWTKQSTNK